MTTLNEFTEKKTQRIDWRIAGGYVLAIVLLASLFAIH